MFKNYFDPKLNLINKKGITYILEGKSFLIGNVLKRNNNHNEFSSSRIVFIPNEFDS